MTNQQSHRGNIGSNDHATTANLRISSIEESSSSQQLVSYDHSSITSQKPRTSAKNGFFVKNIDNIDQRFICQSCKLVLREPYQLHCGHRQCQSCIDVRNNTIHCLLCSKTSETNKIWFDKGLQAELESLTIFCSVCDWTGQLKTYQDHLDQNHVNRFFICSFCTEQIDRNKIGEHYATQTHQLMLLKIVLHLKSKQMKYNRQQAMKYSQFHDRMYILSNDISSLDIKIQRIENKFSSQEHSFALQINELFLVKIFAQEVNLMIMRQDFYMQEILSLKQQFKQKQSESFNGILTWKISDVQEKLIDAKAERQCSIYSSEFYSSPSGYKMRSRLFLNGINDVRNEYMSIYFILMRSTYDAILKWPFNFKVTFSLLNQLANGDNRHHLIKVFWPDTRMKCFQRPRLEMNEAYGIRKFILLDEFQQNQNQYVQDNTMFIKIEIDFLSTPPENLFDSGEMLIIDEQHTSIEQDDLMRKIALSPESFQRIQ